MLWHVRLWEYDRAVPHVMGTEVLIAFARANGLPSLEAEIDRLVRRAREDRGGSA